MLLASSGFQHARSQVWPVAWSAGGLNRRSCLQLFASSAFGISQCAEAQTDVALEPSKCLAPYEAGGCALQAKVPLIWRNEPVENPMRLAQWTLDLHDLGKRALRDGKNADVVIFYLPLGSSVEEQIARWENEFPPASRTSGPMRSGNFDISKRTPLLLEVAGGWSGGGPAGSKTGAPLKSDYAMRAAIVPAAVAGKGERQYAFFVKSVGPKNVVEANDELFKAFVASMKIG